MTEPENKYRAEFDRIRMLPDDALLDEFEKTVRNGAGEGYTYLVWRRKELLRRLAARHILELL